MKCLLFRIVFHKKNIYNTQFLRSLFPLASKTELLRTHLHLLPILEQEPSLTVEQNFLLYVSLHAPPGAFVHNPALANIQTFSVTR